MTIPQLTKKQAEIVQFLRDSTRACGPTVREIQARFNFRSPNGAACHLRALERKGVIRRDPRKVRAIEVLI
jgi:repressor LexA